MFAEFAKTLNDAWLKAVEHAEIDWDGLSEEVPRLSSEKGILNAFKKKLLGRLGKLGESFVLYRMIQAKKVNLKRLGCHWTYDLPSASSAYHGLFDEDKPQWLVAAVAHTGDVDWEETIIAHLQRPWEHEVFIHGKPVVRECSLVSR